MPAVGGTVASQVAPNAAARNVIQFATPASGYTATTAAQVDVSGTRYSAVANVTSRVQSGGSGTYRVAGLQAGRGGCRQRHINDLLAVIQLKGRMVRCLEELPESRRVVDCRHKNTMFQVAYRGPLEALGQHFLQSR